MRFVLTAALILSAAPALAADAEKGAKEFGRCKSCHMIANGDEVLVKGGKTGPNLFGVIGRPVASAEEFSYGSGILAAAETGLVWDEASLAEYITDPNAWLAKVTGDSSVRSKMTFKLKQGAEDVAAYLATFSAASN